MAVKQGYKQTEVGVIPEDWEVKGFGEICKVNQGLQIAIEERLKVPTVQSKIYITIQYLNSGKTVEYIDDYTTTVCCTEDDVLMTRTGNTGMVVTGVSGVFHNNFFKINFDRKQVDRRFLVEYLKIDKIRHIILVKAGTSTIPDLNHSDFYSIPVILPPLYEQQAIAEALSDVDGLISALDALIAKQRAIKQGAMQELLTGQRRLPGFAGEWEVKKLGEIAEISSGGTPDRKEDSYWNGTIPWITTSQIDSNRITAAEEFITEIGLANSSAKKFNKNTLLMAMYGQGKTRGKVAILGIDATINQACAAISIQQNISVEYIFFNLSQRYEEIRSLSNTGNQENLNGNIIKAIPILLPPPAEQTAIAQILADMDDAIAALVQKRAKTVALKQGMMQALLTGQVRLV